MRISRNRCLPWLTATVGLTAGALVAAATHPAPAATAPGPALADKPTPEPAALQRALAALAPSAPPERPQPDGPPRPVAPPFPWLERDHFGRDLQDGMVITGRTPHRLILFTFDDGPNTATTPKLLDYLDVKGVRGVFFFTAARLKGETQRQRAQQEIAREIVRRGHTVASHTVDHLSLLSLDNEEIHAQLTGAERIFEEVFGQRPFLFRPPGGNRSERIDGLIADRHYTQVLWNLGTGDTQVSTADEVVETWKRVLDRREREDGDRGGVILLHDLHDHAVEAFPRIVDELWERNCSLLDQGEELYDIVDNPSLFFVERAPEDPPGALAPPLVLPPAILAERQARLRVETEQRCSLQP